METVIKSMRSLLNTSKNGLLEKHLRRDFREMEGCEIPYKSFGYNTLLDFIRESGEFDWYSTNEGMQIHARVSQNSQHIVSLVGSQNRDRRKKSTKSMPFRPQFNPRQPATVNQGYSSHTPQRRQQNSQYFANTTNRNNNNFSSTNNNNNSTYSRNASQPTWAATNSKPNYNGSAQTQVKPQPNNAFANSNANVAANAAVPKSTVNARLNPSYQPNQNHSGRDTLPVELKSTLPPAAVNATAAAKQKAASGESDWDDEPSNVIDLTKSSSECDNAPPKHQQQGNGQFACDTADKISSNGAKWKHDLYAINQKDSNAKPPPLLKPSVLSAQSSIKNGAVDPKKNISSSWFTYGTSTKEPVKKPSVFNRLGPKEKPSNGIQSRLIVKPKIEMQTDTVDFVQQQPKLQQNSLHDAIAAAIGKKVPSKVVTYSESETNSTKSSSKQMLEMYCHEKDFDAPAFECRRSRFKKFVGTVFVEGVKYSTEPIEYDTEMRAENAVAAKALENFKEFPVANDSCDDIAERIFDCIGDNGVFLKYLTNIFEQKYGESLPDGWENIIYNRPEIFSVNWEATNFKIVFKNLLELKMPPLVKPLPSQSTKSLVCDDHVPIADGNDAHASKPDANELPAMKLPWNQPQWKISVTAATSSVDIWGRNLEAEDWDALDDALGCIEHKFASDSTRPRPCQDHEIIAGDLYMIVHETQSDEPDKKSHYHAYRVRVEEVNRTKRQALCFYIDDGYNEWLDYETKLFHLNRNLLKYPAQAIQFSLCNVQDFEENAFACEEIRSQLLGDKSFMATVKTTQEQFEKQLERIDATAQINVILYDISSEPQRNVNKDILQKICAQLQPPQLNPRSTSIVSITACEECDVFCRLYGSKEMQLVQRILDRVLKTVDIAKYNVQPEQLLQNDGKKKLYLVHDQGSKRYYRAIILPTTTRSNEEPTTVQCRCIDYGFVKSIPCHDIYDLTKLSYALSNYPSQAIRVQLNGIESSEYTADGIQRMRELLVSQKPVYLDIITRSECPIVDVWRTIDGQECLLNGAAKGALHKPLNAGSLPGGSFSSAEPENDRNGHLELHPQPKSGEVHFATVTTALNPSLFYVRLDINDSTYNKMINCLWKDCENSDKILSKNDIKLNHLYAARLQDGFWHRVKVQAFPTTETVAVQKWDFGDIDHLSIDALRSLNETYHEVHQMVFRARLHDVQPCRNSWNTNDCARFHELAVGRRFKIEIKDVRRADDNSYVTELTLIRPDQSNIGDILIQEQRAI